jgi:anti-sigma B factor antagonist
MLKLERLDVRQVGDVTIVRFRDQSLTESRGIEEIAQELFHLVEGEDCQKLVVSLASVSCMSSAALGKLITLNKKATAHGGALKLSSMNADISLVFSVTQLDRLFDIEKDEDHAIRAFREESSRPRKDLSGAPTSSWRSLWLHPGASNAHA